MQSPERGTRTTGNSNRQAAKKGPRSGSDAVAKTHNVTDCQKWVGSVGAEQPTDPAASREFACLLTSIALSTQSLCVTASGNEVSLITLKLEVAKDMHYEP